MTLVINGENREIRDGLTVAGLLESFGIEPVRVAVEVNLNIIKKAEYSEHILKDGDAVEIVNFVGGG